MEQADDLKSITQERFKDLAKGGEYPFRLVYTMPNFKTWAVRIYIGSETRLIGYTDDLTTACRFADMAQMRFWKYRIRGACEPVEADLNFSVEQARNDCANEEKAAALLDNIEQYLKDINAISAVDKVPIRSDRDMRRTVRHDMLSLFVETQNMIKALHVKMDALCTRLNAVELRTVSIDKDVDVLVKSQIAECVTSMTNEKPVTRS
jgi:hypothetical protein